MPTAETSAPASPLRASWVARGAARALAQLRPRHARRTLGAALPRHPPADVLERSTGGPSGRRHLDAASPAGTVRVRSGALGHRRAVIVATERMDEDTGWRMLDPGELIAVDAELQVSSRTAVERPPAHLLRLEDLEPRAARSQERIGAS